jgi:putative oxidoreductase
MTRITQIPSDDRVSGASGAWFLAARLCLAAVFLYSGAAKLLFWSGGIEEFAALGLPMPALALAATIVLQLGAGTALAIGWRSGPAALALAAFTVAATLVGHPFWAFDGADFHRQLTIALEHLAIVGGLLAIAAAGPGLFSLQSREHSS